MGVVFTGLALTTTTNLLGLTLGRHIQNTTLEERVSERIFSISSAERELEEGFVVDLSALEQERRALRDDLVLLGRRPSPEEARLAGIDTSETPAPRPLGAAPRAAAAPPHPAAVSARKQPPVPLAVLASLSCGGSIALVGLLGAFFFFWPRSEPPARTDHSALRSPVA